jgi:hypothetical protein
VVNPFGVTEPTIGWKRAPLSEVATHLVFLISVYILYLELNTWTHAHVCTLINGLCIELFAWCFDQK